MKLSPLIFLVVVICFGFNCQAKRLNHGSGLERTEQEECISKLLWSLESQYSLPVRCAASNKFIRSLPFSVECLKVENEFNSADEISEELLIKLDSEIKNSCLIPTANDFTEDQTTEDYPTASNIFPHYTDLLGNAILTVPMIAAVVAIIVVRCIKK